MNKYISIAALVLAGALVVFFLGSTDLPEEQSIKIGYNVQSVNHAPLIIASTEGFFDKRGVNVEVIPLKSGREVRHALAIGQLDIGAGGFGNFLIVIEEEAPVKIIAPSVQTLTQIFVDPSSKIKTLKDLEGSTVVTRLGSAGNLFLNFALNEEEIDRNLIDFIELEKSATPAVLMSDQSVSAALTTEFERVIYERAGAQVLDEWVSEGYSDELFPISVLAVNTEFLEENRDAVDLFFDALIESHSFLLNNPEQASEIISDQIHKDSSGAVVFSSEDIQNTWKRMDYVLWQDLSIFEESSEIARQIGDIQTQLLIDEIFDRGFEEKLDHAQKTLYQSR